MACLLFVCFHLQIILSRWCIESKRLLYSWVNIDFTLLIVGTFSGRSILLVIYYNFAIYSIFNFRTYCPPMSSVPIKCAAGVFGSQGSLSTAACSGNCTAGILEFVKLKRSFTILLSSLSTCLKQMQFFSCDSLYRCCSLLLDVSFPFPKCIQVIFATLDLPMRVKQPVGQGTLTA